MFLTSKRVECWEVVFFYKKEKAETNGIDSM